MAEYSLNRVPCIRVLLKRFVSEEPAFLEHFVQQEVGVKIKTYIFFYTLNELVTDNGTDFTQQVS